MKRYLIAAIVLAIIFFAGGCTPKTMAIEPAAGSPNATMKNETLPPPTSETEMYSRRLGISIEEAERRMKLSDEAGKLQAELVSKESETFAGLWIEHTPTFKVIVEFTENGEETIKPYLQPDLAAVIEVRSAERSLSELEIARMQMASSLRALGVKFYGVGIEHDTRYRFIVTDRSLIDKAIENGTLVLPDYIEIVVGPLAVPQ